MATQAAVPKIATLLDQDIPRFRFAESVWLKYNLFLINFRRLRLVSHSELSVRL